MIFLRLGIRVSDVCRLKFENDFMEENKIDSFNIKQAHLLELPILADVGNAIIDYLK